MRQELGFDAAPIDRAIEAIEHDDFKAKSPFAANRRVLRVFAERGRFEVDDVRSAIEVPLPSDEAPPFGLGTTP